MPDEYGDGGSGAAALVPKRSGAAAAFEDVLEIFEREDGGGGSAATALELKIPGAATAFLEEVSWKVGDDGHAAVALEIESSGAATGLLWSNQVLWGSEAGERFRIWLE